MARSQTRFGTIPFRVLRTSRGSEIAGGWDRSSYTAEEHVPGSDRTITFLMGRGDREAQWRVESPSIEDYQALEDAIQSVETLVLPHGTQNAPCVVHDEFGDLYDHIDGVVLLALANTTVHRTNRGPAVQADATFRMPVS